MTAGADAGYAAASFGSGQCGISGSRTTTIVPLPRAERMRMRSFKRGETLFRKDDPGLHLYVVLAGAVKIALPGEFGQEALVSLMRTGDFFGELALFDGSPRSASATALEDTKAAKLPGKLQKGFVVFESSGPSW